MVAKASRLASLVPAGITAKAFTRFHGGLHANLVAVGFGERVTISQAQRLGHRREFDEQRISGHHATPPPDTARRSQLLAAAVNSTVVAGENLTVGSTVWLPAESVAPGR